MLLSKLLENCGAIACAVRERDITNVTARADLVRPGGMFIALEGERFDGRTFIGEALSRGAECIVTKDGSFPKSAVVGDTDEASSVIFSNYYGRPAEMMTCVAITGTNGKTTSASCLESILSHAGAACALIGTAEFLVNGKRINKDEFFPPYSSSMTTPDAENFYRALSYARDEGCDTVVFEASSHALDRKRFAGMRIDLGVFTNISREHLDYHGDMESYFAAKKRLADVSGQMITNVDDTYGMRLFEEYRTSLGMGSKEASRPLFTRFSDVLHERRGTSYTLTRGLSSRRIETPMWGDFALYNTLAACSAALCLGVGIDVCAESVAKFPGARGRMEVVSARRGEPTLVIDYAHTPDALEKALVCVRRHCKGRVVLVFGCGGERDVTKRAPMGKAAERYADFTYVTDDNPRGEDPEKITCDIVEGFGDSDSFEVIHDRRRAIRRAVMTSEEGDVVLCCGKGHEQYIIDKCGKRFFDERAILLEALCEKYGKR